MTRAGRIVLAVATVLFVTAALREAWTDGLTYDEAYAMTSGAAGWTRHDLRLTSQHPPLGKAIASVPLLFLHPDLPRGAVWDRGDGSRAASEFVHTAYTKGRLHKYLFVSRVIPILVTAATAWLIALLATGLFGNPAGLFAGLLWLVNPFVLGIGHLDGIDMPATLTTVLTALAVLYARRAPSTKRILFVGVCGGLAILARVSGLLVVSTAALALMTPAWRAGWRRVVARGATVVAMSWLTVMVAYAVLSPVDIRGHGGALHAVAATVWHIVMPPNWLHGTAHLWRVGNVPGPSFILGQMHTGRWLLFWPGSIIVKLPPATVAVLIAGPFAWFGLSRAVRRDAAMVVGIPAIVHTIFTVQQERPIGLRYELPALALWLVAASPIVTVLTGWARRGVAFVTVGSAAALLVITPSIAWTNPLLGSSYQQATDSNLDWGQGFPALARWSPGHHPWVAYFGNGLTWRDVPDARNLVAAPADFTGWVAISASELTAYARVYLGWLRAYCPVRVLDRSILVYRFTTPPVRPLDPPERPASPCRGNVSVRV